MRDKLPVVASTLIIIKVAGSRSQIGVRPTIEYLKSSGMNATFQKDFPA